MVTLAGCCHRDPRVLCLCHLSQLSPAELIRAETVKARLVSAWHVAVPPQLIPGVAFSSSTRAPGVGGDVLNTRTQRAQSTQHTPSRAQCQCGEPERNS